MTVTFSLIQIAMPRPAAASNNPSSSVREDQPATTGASANEPEDRVETGFDLAKLPYLKSDTDEADETAITEDPEVTRHSRDKYMARDKLQRLIEELKVVKKVWANKPEELGKQMLRLAKELADAVKQYQKAQAALAKILGAKSGMSLGGVSLPPMFGAGMPSMPAAPPEKDAEQQAEAAGDAADAAEQEAQSSESAADEAEQGASIAETSASAPNADLARGAKAYQTANTERVRLDQTPYANELRGDIEFAGMARSFATELRKVFEEGHKKAANLPGDSEEREKFLKKVGKALEKFEQDLMEWEGSLKRAMPPAIYVDMPKQQMQMPALPSVAVPAQMTPAPVAA